MAASSPLATSSIGKLNWRKLMGHLMGTASLIGRHLADMCMEEKFSHLLELHTHMRLDICMASK
eukprot:40864-Pelagomonas_calceolata.AAC.1